MAKDNRFFTLPSRRVLWARSIALLITFSFLLPYLTWAFDNGNYQLSQSGFSGIQYVGRELTIPQKFGTIQQKFQGSGKTVVCIQDLHCNYEVQKNIANIIRYMSENHGLKLMGEEGAFGTVNLEVLRGFPLAHVREEISDYFVKQGKLTGAELFAAVNPAPIRLEGVESQDLYEASYTTIRSFLTAESQGYVSDLRDMLESLKPGLYTPGLIRFDDSGKAFRKGSLDLFHYVSVLKTYAAKLRVDTRELESFNRFVRQGQASAGEAGQDALYRELDQLDAEIRERLYTAENQKQLDQLGRGLDQIEKLINISATPEEVKRIQSRRSEYAVKIFREFIRQYDPQFSDLWDEEISSLDGFVDQAMAFYTLADRRSIRFVDNLLKKMDNAQENLAVMINGGFHAEGIAAELKRRNISFIAVQPRLTRQDWVNPYYSLLQGKKLPLEKLLEKKQSIFAVHTWTESVDFKRVMEALLGSIALARMPALDLKGREALQAFLAKLQVVHAASLAPEALAELGLPVASVFARLEVADGNPDLYVLAAASENWPDEKMPVYDRVKLENFDGLGMAFGSRQDLLQVAAGLRSGETLWAGLKKQAGRVFELLARLFSRDSLTNALNLFFFDHQAWIDFAQSPNFVLFLFGFSAGPAQLSAIPFLAMGGIKAVGDENRHFARTLLINCLSDAELKKTMLEAPLVQAKLQTQEIQAVLTQISSDSVAQGEIVREVVTINGENPAKLRTQLMELLGNIAWSQKGAKSVVEKPKPVEKKVEVAPVSNPALASADALVKALYDDPTKTWELWKTADPKTPAGRKTRILFLDALHLIGVDNPNAPMGFIMPAFQQEEEMADLLQALSTRSEFGNLVAQIRGIRESESQGKPVAATLRVAKVEPKAKGKPGKEAKPKEEIKAVDQFAKLNALKERLENPVEAARQKADEEALAKERAAAKEKLEAVAKKAPKPAKPNLAEIFKKQQVESKLQVSRQSFQDGDLKTTWNLVQEVLKIDPLNSEAKQRADLVDGIEAELDRAEALKAEGKLPEAAEVYSGISVKFAEKLQGMDVWHMLDARMDIARVLLGQNRLSLAQGIAEAVLLLDSESPEAQELVKSINTAVMKKRIDNLLEKAKNALATKRGGELAKALLWMDQALEYSSDANGLLGEEILALRAGIAQEQQAQQVVELERRVEIVMAQGHWLDAWNQIRQARSGAGNIELLTLETKVLQRILETAKTRIAGETEKAAELLLALAPAFKDDASLQSTEFFQTWIQATIDLVRQGLQKNSELELVFGWAEPLRALAPEQAREVLKLLAARQDPVGHVAGLFTELRTARENSRQAKGSEKAELEATAKKLRAQIGEETGKVAVYFRALHRAQAASPKGWEFFIQTALADPFALPRLYAAAPEDAMAGLEALAETFPSAITGMWKDRKAFEARPEFRAVLRQFMLTRWHGPLAVLNAYLEQERKYLIAQELAGYGADKANYVSDLLVSVKSVYELSATGTLNISDLRNYYNLALGIVDDILRNDFGFFMDNMFTLEPAGESMVQGKIGMPTEVTGYLFARSAKRLIPRILEASPESDAEKLALWVSRMHAYFLSHEDTKGLSPAIDADMHKMLEAVTDQVYKEGSFKNIDAKTARFFQAASELSEVSLSPFMFRPELEALMSREDAQELIQLLHASDLSFKNRMAIIFRLAMLWDTALKNKTLNIQNLKKMCGQPDPLVRSNVYFAMALIRGKQSQLEIQKQVNGPEFVRLMSHAVTPEGEVDPNHVLTMLHMLWMGEDTEKILMTYAVVASLALNGSVVINLDGKRQEFLLKEGLDARPAIAAILQTALAHEWLQHEPHAYQIVRDTLHLLETPMPENEKREIYGRIIRVMSLGPQAKGQVWAEYEKAVAPLRAAQTKSGAVASESTGGLWPLTRGPIVQWLMEKKGLSPAWAARIYDFGLALLVENKISYAVGGAVVGLIGLAAFVVTGNFSLLLTHGLQAGWVLSWGAVFFPLHFVTSQGLRAPPKRTWVPALAITLINLALAFTPLSWWGLMLAAMAVHGTVNVIAPGAARFVAAIFKPGRLSGGQFARTLNYITVAFVAADALSVLLFGHPFLSPKLTASLGMTGFFLTTEAVLDVKDVPGTTALPAQRVTYLASLEPRVVHQGPEAPAFVEIQNTSRPEEVITLVRKAKLSRSNQAEEYIGAIPGDGPGREIKILIYFYPGFLELIKIQVGEAGVGRGIASSIAQWLLQLAKTTFPATQYPLHFRAVENPASLGIAENIFQPGTLQIQDASREIPDGILGPWQDLWDPKVDLYRITGPVYVPWSSETIRLERRGNEYIIRSAPKGYKVNIHGARIEVFDPSGRRVNGLRTDTDGYGYYNLKGIPRQLASSPAGSEIQAQEAFAATARPRQYEHLYVSAPPAVQTLEKANTGSQSKSENVFARAFKQLARLFNPVGLKQALALFLYDHQAWIAFAQSPYFVLFLFWFSAGPAQLSAIPFLAMGGIKAVGDENRHFARTILINCLTSAELKQTMLDAPLVQAKLQTPEIQAVLTQISSDSIAQGQLVQEVAKINDENPETLKTQLRELLGTIAWSQKNAKPVEKPKSVEKTVKVETGPSQPALAGVDAVVAALFNDPAEIWSAWKTADLKTPAGRKTRNLVLDALHKIMDENGPNVAMGFIMPAFPGNEMTDLLQALSARSEFGNLAAQIRGIRESEAQVKPSKPVASVQVAKVVPRTKDKPGIKPKEEIKAVDPFAQLKALQERLLDPEAAAEQKIALEAQAKEKEAAREKAAAAALIKQAADKKKADEDELARQAAANKRTEEALAWKQLEAARRETAKAKPKTVTKEEPKAQQQSTDPFTQKLNELNQLLETGKYLDARKAYKNILDYYAERSSEAETVASEFIQVKITKAQGHLEAREFRDARITLQNIYEFEPGNSAAGNLSNQFVRGKIDEANRLLEAGIIDEAKTALQDVTDFAPENAEAKELPRLFVQKKIALVKKALDKREVDAAKVALQLVLAVSPGNVEARGILGVFCEGQMTLARNALQESQAAQAGAAIKAVLAMDPSHAQALALSKQFIDKKTAEAALALKQGRFIQAQKAAQDILVLDPQNAQAVALAGVLHKTADELTQAAQLRTQNKLSEAAEMYGKVAANSIEDLKTAGLWLQVRGELFLIAQTLMEQDSLERARKTAETLGTLAPEDQAIATLKAKIEVAANNKRIRTLLLSAKPALQSGQPSELNKALQNTEKALTYAVAPGTDAALQSEAEGLKTELEKQLEPFKQKEQARQVEQALGKNQLPEAWQGVRQLRNLDPASGVFQQLEEKVFNAIMLETQGIQAPKLGNAANLILEIAKIFQEDARLKSSGFLSPLVDRLVQLAQAHLQSEPADLGRAGELTDHALVLDPGNVLARQMKRTLTEHVNPELFLTNAFTELFNLRKKIKEAKGDQKKDLEEEAKQVRRNIMKYQEQPLIYFQALYNAQKASPKVWENFTREFLPDTLIMQIPTVPDANTRMKALARTFPSALVKLIGDRKLLERNPDFRKTLWEVMLTGWTGPTSLLSYYLGQEKKYVLEQEAAGFKNRAEGYASPLLSTMQSQYETMAKIPEAERDKREVQDMGALLNDATIMLLAIIEANPGFFLELVVALKPNEEFKQKGILDFPAAVIGGLFVKNEKFARVLLNQWPEADIDLLAGWFVQFHQYLLDLNRADFLNALDVSFSKQIDYATDKLFETNSFTFEPKLIGLIEGVHKRDKLVITPVRVRKELEALLPISNPEELVARLEKPGLTHNEQMAIALRLAIIWTQALNAANPKTAKEIAGNIQTLIEHKDPLVSAILSYGAVCIRNLNYKLEALKAVDRKYILAYETLLQGGEIGADKITLIGGKVDENTLLRMLYLLRTQDAKMKLSVVYSIFGSLVFNHKVALRMDGKQWRVGNVLPEEVPKIKAAFETALAKEWVREDFETDTVIKDFLLLQNEEIMPLAERRGIYMEILDLITAAPKFGKPLSEEERWKKYETIVAPVRAALEVKISAAAAEPTGGLWPLTREPLVKWLVEKKGVSSKWAARIYDFGLALLVENKISYAVGGAVVGLIGLAAFIATGNFSLLLTHGFNAGWVLSWGAVFFPLHFVTSQGLRAPPKRIWIPALAITLINLALAFTPLSWWGLMLAAMAVHGTVNGIAAVFAGIFSGQMRQAAYGEEFIQWQAFVNAHDKRAFLSTFQKTQEKNRALSPDSNLFPLVAGKLYFNDTLGNALQSMDALLSQQLGHEQTQTIRDFTRHIADIMRIAQDSIYPSGIELEALDQGKTQEIPGQILRLRNQHLEYWDQMVEKIRGVAPGNQFLSDAARFYRNRLELFFNDLEIAMKKTLELPGGNFPTNNPGKPLAEVLGEGRNGEPLFKNHFLGELLYGFRNRIFGDNLNYLLRHIYLRTGAWFGAGYEVNADYAGLHGKDYDASQALEARDTVFALTIPAVFKGVLERAPEKGWWAKASYALQAALVRSVVYPQLLFFVFQTKLLQARQDLQALSNIWEYVQSRAETLLQRWFPGLGRIRLADFYKNTMHNRDVGITRTEVIKLLDLYRQILNRQAHGLNQELQTQVQSLLDTGQDPTTEALVETLRLVKVENLTDPLMRNLVGQLQAAIFSAQETVRRGGDPKYLRLEINHIADLIIHSRRAAPALTGSLKIEMPQSVELYTDQAHWLFDAQARSGAIGMADALLQAAAGSPFLADLQFLQKVLAQGEVSKADSYQLLAMLETMTSLQSDTSAVLVGEDVTRYVGSLTWGGRAQRFALGKKTLSVVEPAVSTVLAPDAEAIEQLNSGNLSHQVSLVPFQGRLPERLAETGNFQRDLGRFLQTTPGFQGRLSPTQALAQAYYRWHGNPGEKNLRLLSRVLLRIMRNEAKRAEAQPEATAGYVAALEAMNHLFADSSVFRGNEKLGTYREATVHLPACFRQGEKLRYLALWRKAPDFIAARNVEMEMQRQQLLNFRTSGAA
jgi:soluble cytochrome b562